MITQEQLGIDERINEAFQPISNFWEGLILHEFFGTGIPTIIFLLAALNEHTLGFNHAQLNPPS